MANILSNSWIQKRRPYWDRLASLVAAADQSRLRGLSRAQLRELALLYRQTASDLSTLRQDRTSGALAAQVNQLMARAHHIIYSSRKSSWRNLWIFFRDTYPVVFRSQFRFTLAATLMMLGAAVLAAGFSVANPHFAYSILGPGVMSSVERHEMWTRSLVTVAPQAASGIMTNNITVSILAFAGGLLFGFGSVYLMFTNGLMLGAVAVVCQQAGMSIPLWSFVAAHGSLELPAIAIAGGGGVADWVRDALPGELPVEGLGRAGGEGGGAAGVSDCAHADCGGVAGGFSFAVGCAGLGEVWCGSNFVYGPECMAVPSGAAGGLKSIISR